MNEAALNFHLRIFEAAISFFFLMTAFGHAFNFSKTLRFRIKDAFIKIPCAAAHN